MEHYNIIVVCRLYVPIPLPYKQETVDTNICYGLLRFWRTIPCPAHNRHRQKRQSAKQNRYILPSVWSKSIGTLCHFRLVAHSIVNTSNMWRKHYPASNLWRFLCHPTIKSCISCLGYNLCAYQLGNRLLDV